MALALLEVRRLECGEGKSPVPGLGLLSGGLSFRKGTGVSGLLAPRPLQNGALAVCHACQPASPWWRRSASGAWRQGRRMERTALGTPASEVRPTRS